ncbi:MAG: hypothetical protein BGO98_11485 [Myxococcales bacterium 68-20]|nr:hypothetical protein [Myxococcales bacterium]OJY16810.1 MAG: hypothetical protein BGO98_11485 [Myxococcales bacterium 68-20]
MTNSEFALDVIRKDDRRKSTIGHLDQVVLARNPVLRGDRARKGSRRDQSVDRPRMGPFREPRRCMLEALMDKLGDLSDEDLLARLRGHVGKGNVWCAQLIAYLVEVEERRLDRIHACSSLWDFCTRKLGMSESEAHRRIAAARAVRRFPQVLGYIERGVIHLCALYALRKHLTSVNVDELLREASGKSTREVEKMVAARFPRPDVPACVELVAAQAPLSPISPVSVATPSPVSVAMRSDSVPAWSLSLAAPPAPGPRQRIEPLSATRYRIELTVSATTKETIDRIKDLMRHRNPSGDLETILDASLALLLAQLEKERLGKTPHPRGRRRKPAEATNACSSSTSTHVLSTTRDPTAPVDVGATADDPVAHVRSEVTMRAPHGRARVGTAAGDPVAHVRSESKTQDPGAHVHADTVSGNQGVSVAAPANAEPKTAEPAMSTPATKAARKDSRYVPRELRREVFERDGKQCTYVGPDGDRCPARGYLELDHIRPKAHRGTETAANLRVRCRAHNALYAEQVFGRAHVAGRMHLHHRKFAPPAPTSFETSARGLRSPGFREPEVRRVLATLAKKRDMEAAPVETILREALLVLT